jgi:hypothetical protein
MIAGHKHDKEHKGIKAYGKQKQKRSGKKNLPNDLCNTPNQEYQLALNF